MGNLLPNLEKGQDVRPPSNPDVSLLQSASPHLRHLATVVAHLAQSDVPLLLLGERGAGKRHLARQIHDLSKRGERPFRELNCFGLSPEDLAREHQSTSSVGGTIFLKEFSELSASCQSYLRDLLAEEAARAYGKGYATRFISSSSVDLEAEVRARHLREDLYYKMSPVSLRLLPLRQRPEDISIFSEHFLEKYAREYARPLPGLSAQTRDWFRDYAWPGNLRELEDVCRVLVALGNEQQGMGGLRVLLQHRPAESEHGPVSLKAASRAASHETEKELILNVLARTRWNRRQAAKQLQISYKALLYKLKQIGCEGQGLR
jgi:two-component system, NtrC family, response regulator AtoC